MKVWFQNRRIKWRKQNLEQQHAKLASFDTLYSGDGGLGDSDQEDDFASKESSEEDGVNFAFVANSANSVAVDLSFGKIDQPEAELTSDSDDVTIENKENDDGST